MNDHSLRILEFEAIRQRVADQASCSLGQELAREMVPSPDPESVQRRLKETAEAVRLLTSGSTIPFGGVHDIRPAVHAAGIGGLLEPHALLTVAGTLSAARKLRQYLLQRQEPAPTLAELARRMQEFPAVENAITEAIDDSAEVRDEASPVLARLRRQIRTLRGRITERLNSILRNHNYRDMIQDPVVTTRDGRFCIPVKSEYRSQFGGLVHDQSASGATVFMEPQAVVDLGNEIRQEEARERQEVERILRELTAHVGQAAEDISWTLATLAELDFIFARGKLAVAMDATEPRLNNEGLVALRRARHPLLSGDVVPIDIELGGAFDLLVITGPNTGGKTVSLKTVGLLSLMAQCGLHIPAHEGSTVPVFQGVYADIGDEQSIQQSLSTFSGHITNISRILRGVAQTGSRSLVLLDEVGAGTDPTEGAALAKAILDELLRLGARTIASTHYGELKEFAYATPRVENASVEFDLQTLRPTYRLLIGIPGSSNALTIASRLGLPQSIVDHARSLIGNERVELSEVLQQLTDSRRATEQDLRRAAQQAREAEQKREQAERELRRLQEERASTIQKARSEAEELLRTARRELERTREELRRLDKQARRRAEEAASPEGIQKVRDRLNRLSHKVEHRSERTMARAPQAEPPAPVDTVQTVSQPPQPGDLVWISGFNQRGTLLSAPSNGKAQVQIGSMRTTVPYDGLQKIVTPKPAAEAAKPVPRPASPASDMQLRARASISPELKLLGLRADDALIQLEEYLDRASLAGVSPLRIVHGKGTGALRRAVWEHLQSHPHVAGMQHPSDAEGGTGVTIVDLRE